MTNHTTSLQGEFFENSMVNGEMRWVSGERIGDNYIGQFRDAVMHGKGIYRFANGTVFEGNWSVGNFLDESGASFVEKHLDLSFLHRARASER